MDYKVLPPEEMRQSTEEVTLHYVLQLYVIYNDLNEI